ncbi:hypothetical protein BDV98DRAFT_566455 [Pterulicium gracile]|uniref:Uncharacterized protein n=1 Tax=Pterulicium gracile TaxID=1884261 RepID=A0A5C3QKT7_9AGAR|nr:hypothetical protein BDV98DRAFT_566455 [Pterula gracilis]
MRRQSWHTLSQIPGRPPPHPFVVSAHGTAMNEAAETSNCPPAASIQLLKQRSEVRSTSVGLKVYWSGSYVSSCPSGRIGKN